MGGIQVSNPTLTQGLEATPAVVRLERDTKHIAHFPIEVGNV